MGLDCVETHCFDCLATQFGSGVDSPWLTLIGGRDTSDEGIAANTVGAGCLTVPSSITTSTTAVPRAKTRLLSALIKNSYTAR